MNKENVFFNIGQQLYNEYTPLKSTKELHSFLIDTFLDNSFDASTITMNNTRFIFNDFILKYYPNEAVIKSSFIDNVLLKYKDHSTTIFELNSGKSRVDLCKINGISIAFEIKTDLDNFNRLQKQIHDYMLLFEKVYVICSVKNVNYISDFIPNNCGIFSYYVTHTGKYIFKKERDARYSKNISSSAQLSLFTQSELDYNFKINTFHSKKEKIDFILRNYTDEEINKMFKLNFKKKYSKNWQFLKNNYSEIFEIDYQWFFKNNISPELLYGKATL